MEDLIAQTNLLDAYSPLFNLLLTIAGVIVFVIVTVVILRLLLRKLAHRFDPFSIVTLRILMPKDALVQANAQEKKLPEWLQGMENFFMNIASLKAQKGLKHYFLGRDDHLALEIVQDRDGLIYFYISCHEKMVPYIEQQLQASYSHAQMEEATDFNIFTPLSQPSAASLSFSKPYVFPIRSFRQLETDPLNPLTNAFSFLTPGEGACIQFVARSAHPKWHTLSSKLVTQLQSGKKFKDAIRAARANNYIAYMDVFGQMIGKETTQETPKAPGQIEQEMAKTINEKSNKPGLEVNINIVVATDNLERSKAGLRNIVGAFGQYGGYEYNNAFRALENKKTSTVIRQFVYREFDEHNQMILNAEEMTGLYHLPLPTITTPNIVWLKAKKAPVPSGMPTEGIVLGKNVFRGRETVVRMRDDDRRRHTYIIGQSGVGKTNLILTMAVQDIENGKGVAVLDPHGDLVEDILARIPENRYEDVIYFEPSDIERPLGLNLLEYDSKYPEQKTFVINELIKIFDKLYDLKQTGGPIFEQYIRNAMLLVMDDSSVMATLLDIPRVLADAEFRADKLRVCKNQIVVDFWVKEAEKAGGEAALANIVPYITSKLNVFISNDMVRPIVSQQKSAFNIREVIDNGKILLLNLSKGKLGDINAHLIGMVMVGKILMASLSRADIPEEQRRDFYLYLDEFQNFTTDTIGVILSEARKYRLNLILAHQYIGQLISGNDTRVRDAIFGNVGTMVFFRVGIEDAPTCAKILAPVFNEFDVINMEKFNAYTRLLVDNTASPGFSMETFPPSPRNDQVLHALKELSRLTYGKPPEVARAAPEPSFIQ